MEIIKLINTGSKKLKNKQVLTNNLDSELLLSKVLNKTREELLINLHQQVSKNEINIFKKLLNRRSLKEPIAYILKEKEFWSKKFIVNKHVFLFIAVLVITGIAFIVTFWLKEIPLQKRAQKDVKIK